MSKSYIENLVKNLIGSNDLREVYANIHGDSVAFINHTHIQLGARDVYRMKPETLGKIMCSFEMDDVMADKEELVQHATFSGDCEGFLRQLVAICLSYAIYDRLASEEVAEISKSYLEFEKY